MKHHLLYTHPIPKFPIVWWENVTPELVMKAAYYDEHGGESKLKVSDYMIRPKPSDGQILIKVHASCVNPVDVKLHENNVPRQFLPLPKIVGTDVCGTVITVDRSRSNAFEIGDRVVAMMPHLFSGWGSACEYVAIDERLACHAPNNANDLEAASLPLVGLTVLQGFESFVEHHRHDTAGKCVLIQAGAGGLGTFAIQYCKYFLDMVVYATCSTRNKDFVRSLGADYAIDYTCEDFDDVVQDMDVVFDPLCHLYEDRTFRSQVLKPRGSFYIKVASSPHALQQEDRDPLGLAIPEAQPRKLVQGWCSWLVRSMLFHMGCGVTHYDAIYVRPDGARLAQVVELVESGKIKPVVDHVFPLAQIAEAHAQVRQGHTRGKVALRISS